MSTRSFFTSTPPRPSQYVLGALIVLCIFVIGFNLIWIVVDTSPPLWDIAGHSFRSADWLRALLGLHFKEALLYAVVYPPLTYAVTAIEYLFFGFYADIPQFSLQVFTLVLLLSTFGAARRLLGSNRGALLAAIMVAIVPVMAHFMRIYDLDMPLAAMVTVAVYALLRTEGFSNVRWTILFGVVCGLGLITKWTFVVYVSPLVLATLILLFLDPFIIQKFRNVFQLFFYAMPVSLMIAGPWYVTHLQIILDTAEETQKNIFFVPFTDVWSFDNLTYVITQLNYGFGIALFLVALAGLGIILRKLRGYALVMLLTWLIVPAIVFTIVFLSKELRYLLPFVPVLTICAGGTMLAARRRWLRTLVFAWVGVLGFLVWFQTSWGGHILPIDAATLPKSMRFYGARTVTPSDPQYGFTYPTHYAGKTQAAVRLIAEDWRSIAGSGEPVTILIVPNSLYLSPQQVQFYASLLNLDADTTASRTIRQTADNVPLLLDADYIITKTGDQGPPLWATYLENIVAEEARTDGVFAEHFDRIGSATMTTVEDPAPEIRIYRSIRYRTPLP